MFFQTLNMVDLLNKGFLKSKKQFCNLNNRTSVIKKL